MDRHQNNSAYYLSGINQTDIYPKKNSCAVE